MVNKVIMVYGQQNPKVQFLKNINNWETQINL